MRDLIDITLSATSGAKNKKRRDLENKIGELELERETLQNKSDAWDEELIYRDAEGKKRLREKIAELGKRITTLTTDINTLTEQLNILDIQPDGSVINTLVGSILHNPMQSLSNPDTRRELKGLIQKSLTSLVINFEDYTFDIITVDGVSGKYEIPRMKIKTFFGEIMGEVLKD